MRRLIWKHALSRGCFGMLLRPADTAEEADASLKRCRWPSGLLHFNVIPMQNEIRHLNATAEMDI